MSARGRRTSDCIRDGQGICQAYWPGHNLHWIHARKIGESPWGWRDGVVSDCSTDGFVTIQYALELGRVEAWHHDAVIGELEDGTPVRVHEGFYALSSPMGWFNLLISSGLEAVPEPQDKGPWQPEVTGGVVDLATGRGLALDHLHGEDADGV